MALALLALIGVGLAGALQLGTATFVRSQALGVSAHEIAARGQLRRLLTRATSPNLLTHFPKEFSGTDTTLSFVSLASLGFARHSAGIQVNLSEKDGALTMELVLFDDDGTPIETLPYRLAEDVNGFQIRYYSGDPNTGEWVDTWDNTAQLPRLVSIQADPGSIPYWPEFTVELIYAQ